MKIAFLTTDSREHFQEYQKDIPFFGTAPTALLEGFKIIGDPEVHIISGSQTRMASPAKLAKNIWFHGFTMPTWGWLRTGYAGCFLEVRRILEEISPDLVHAQGTERDCAISAIAFRGPKLLTLHGNIRRVAKVLKSAPFSYWWLQARLENWVIPKFDGIICLSHHAQVQVLRRARKTWIVPNAVAPSFFDIQRKPMVPARVLCLATISPLKNQMGLIRALEAHSLNYPFELHFFGSHDPTSLYGRLFLQAISRCRNLFYSGFLDRTSLENELSKASLLILPTFEENCPMVILEAQAAGVPVIASNVGGVPDLIQDGVTGILTDPNQPETMPRALKRLLENPQLSERLAREGRKRALARFHPRVIAARHLDIYRELVACR